MTDLLHGLEPFLRCHHLCSYSRTSQHFMEPKGSLPCAQGPSNCPYSKPDQSSPSHPSIHPPMSWFSWWSFSFWLSHFALLPIHYITVSNILSLHISLVQKFSSAPNSQTLLVYFTLHVRHHVSHPYRTTYIFTVLLGGSHVTMEWRII
jgi:hypothetical protein